MGKNIRYILLVDDEQNIINALQRELADWVAENSLDILAALSAKDGLELLKTHGADTVLVISDLKMPEMKGSDFLLAVKAAYPHIVSILLTGFSETQEVIKAVGAGIFSYILKPWDSDYLIAEVEKAFGHGETRRQNENYVKMVADELRWAGEMQKAILKPNLPHSEGVEFRATYRPVPALYCGGDYYDVIYLGSERYLMLIGDVVGHGVKAAFITGILKAIIYSEYVRGLIGKDFSPGAFLTWMNERMNFEFRASSGIMITFFAGVLDMRAKQFKYANAGQRHPFLIRTGVPQELPVSGAGLGTSRSITYADQGVPFKTGDTIFMYTSGLTEVSPAEPGTDTVKIKPLLEGVPVGADYHRRILDTALATAKAADFSDDVSIVTARIL